MVLLTRLASYTLALFMTTGLVAQSPQSSQNPLERKAGRSVVRTTHGMVATSQPLATEVGVQILERGGNAIDAAIAVAAMLNVTEPMMTGIGGDMWAIVYWAKDGKLHGLNASGRAPKALTPEYFAKKGLKAVPIRGMEPITVPGAVDGWYTLLNQYGTMKMPDLLQPAIRYADEGYPVMEKASEDWEEVVDVLKRDPAAASTYLINGEAPKPGYIFKNAHLANSLRILASGGRDAYYKGPIGQAIVDYCQKHGGFLTMEDFAAQHAEWVNPISTNYRGYDVYEMPPNGQGLTVLLALNILEGYDLASMKSQPDLYYHTLIETMKLAFADRNRYIADPKFAKVPVDQLLSKEYAAKRRALIKPDSVLSSPPPGDIQMNSETTYFTIVDKDHNAVSFINSLYEHFGSGIVAGDTGIVLHDRGAGFSLDPKSPNLIAPGKRPFHTLIPAMVMKDGKPFMSFGVMGGDMQPQGHVLVLTNMIDMGMDIQHAIETPRFRYMNGNRVYLETEMGKDVIDKLTARGHQAMTPRRNQMGGGQAIIIDPKTGALLGGSDIRKDGMAAGY